MTQRVALSIDGREISAEPGQTILQAATASGIYIPQLCAHRELVPLGACRVCVVRVNGRTEAACVQPVAPGMMVESDTPELLDLRRAVVEMLFVERNHICPSCEQSGKCELQAVAYRLGILVPRYPFLFPRLPVDATHPDIYVDHNRCILCGRCVVASRDLDRKGVFDFVGRSIHKLLAFDAATGLGATRAEVQDRAFDVCPVGALLRKRTGFRVPIGQRPYDRCPIGSDVERSGSAR
jgi:[NiFe] hydrogenase diaphorase moiety small subunit